MPVRTIICKQSYLGCFLSARKMLLRTFSTRMSGIKLPPMNSSVHNRQGLTLGHTCILRNLSVTSNTQIFSKLTSFISKLAVEPDVPDKPAQPHVVSQNDSKLSNAHQELLETSGSFLNEYNKDLNSLMKEVQPLTQKNVKVGLVRKAKRTYKKKERAQKVKERLRFFHFDKLCRPVVTPQFKEMYLFLNSLDVPCDELQYFPDIQRMTNDEIMMCIDLLKSYGIHRVFSLLLIQRALAELKVGISRTNPAKLRDGRTAVSHLSQVRLYLNLCRMLNQPDLDIVHLLDQLTETNGYESMETLQTKVRKLLSVGATPEIIWDNLELLTLSKDIFNKKIKLFKHSVPVKDSPFPVALFLTNSFVKFQERLSVSHSVVEISDMLRVSPGDFQACWGASRINLSLKELARKVRMCVQVGIPKKDVFNNLSILNNIPIDKCYRVTSSFRATGLPVSIFIFDEMAQANDQINGSAGNRQRSNNSRDWETIPDNAEIDLTRTSQETDTEKCSLTLRISSGEERTTESADIRSSSTLSKSPMSNLSEPQISSLEMCGEMNASHTDSEIRTSLSDTATFSNKTIDTLKPAESNLFEKSMDSFTSASSEQINVRKSSKKSTRSVKKDSNGNSTDSSKRSRRVLFNLLAHLLRLDPPALSRVFQSGVSSVGVSLLDLTRNLDFLLASGFTRTQVAQCPLVLVHPHSNLRAAADKVSEVMQADWSAQCVGDSLGETFTESTGKNFGESSEEMLGSTVGKSSRVTSEYAPIEPLLNREMVDSENSVSPSFSSSSSSYSSSSHSSSSHSSSSHSSSSHSSSSHMKQPPCVENETANTQELSSTPPKQYFSSHSQTSSTLATGNTKVKQKNWESPLEDGVCCLNVLQYLLEKEASFSLSSAASSAGSAFLNRRL